VDAKDTLADDGSDRQAIEDVAKGAPESDVEAITGNLVKEAIDAADAAAFMVATKEEDLLAVEHFEREEAGKHLKAITSSVDVVAKEEKRV
jgi:hypothetical protein